MARWLWWLRCVDPTRAAPLWPSTALPPMNARVAAWLDGLAVWCRAARHTKAPTAQSTDQLSTDQQPTNRARLGSGWVVVEQVEAVGCGGGFAAGGRA
ncbi:hypothetical protein Skr01_43420 [Sphaerisporangium krabiense]|nr:hypothetical protein Skr01_43420 [Sphaerisporangium krabiense]